MYVVYIVVVMRNFGSTVRCNEEKYFANLFATVQEDVVAYSRCREAVKLFRFLLSP
jgi:hypothetical protein